MRSGFTQGVNVWINTGLSCTASPSRSLCAAAGVSQLPFSFRAAWIEEKCAEILFLLFLSCSVSPCNTSRCRGLQCSLILLCPQVFHPSRYSTPVPAFNCSHARWKDSVNLAEGVSQTASSLVNWWPDEFWTSSAQHLVPGAREKEKGNGWMFAHIHTIALVVY